jgi:NADPH-dependent F420 reductase
METAFRPTEQVISILGGTGKEGKGLAYRWALAGLQVIIGSRQLEKAQQAASELNGRQKFTHPVMALENGDAAAKGGIVVLTVPYPAHAELVSKFKDSLQRKIVIDVAVPLVLPKVTKVQMPKAGSAAQEALAILGEGAQVASAFHNISYERLLEDRPVDCDVLVCGTGKQTRDVVLDLVSKAGLVGWDAGPIENSVVAEGMTSVLIGINKQFGIQNAGIKITGVDREK